MRVPTIVVLAGAVALPLLAQEPPPPPPFPRMGMPPPPGMGPERQLVKEFDRDGDKRLNAEERKAALAVLSKEQENRPMEFPPRGGKKGGGPGGSGGFFRKGGPPRPMLEPAKPGVKLQPGGVKAYGKEPLYDPAALRTVFIEFDEADWEKQLAAFHNTDVEIPATVTVDGSKYASVGVNFRGNSSFMMVPEGHKRSLKLSFDYADDGQTLGGYRTVTLLNSHMDPTFMRTVLFMEIARKYLPAPKANFMRVAINGESWGLYINAQQYNTDFVRQWYKPAKGGARWKSPGMPFARAGLSYLGDDIEVYRKIYEIKSKDTPESWKALVRLCKVLNETPPAQLEAALAPILDVEQTLRFLALDKVFINNDGYWTRASDYNIYLDAKGRFHIIPHDANETFHPAEQFGPGGPGGPGRRFPFPPPPPPLGFEGDGGGAPPFPMPPPGMMPPPPFGRPRSNKIDLDPFAGSEDPNKALLHRLLAAPALKQRYISLVKRITTESLDWKKLEPVVRRYRALIEADVAADTRKLSRTEDFAPGIEGAENEERGEMSLKTFVEKRRAYLLAHEAVRAAR